MTEEKTIARPVQILRRPEVERRTGLARSSLYKAIAEGLFPKQIRLGPRAVGWRSDEVEQWIEKRTNESREVA